MRLDDVAIRTAHVVHIQSGYILFDACAHDLFYKQYPLRTAIVPEMLESAST
jgi:hypothetical protein